MTVMRSGAMFFLPLARLLASGHPMVMSNGMRDVWCNGVMRRIHIIVCAGLSGCQGHWVPEGTQGQPPP